MMLSAKQKEIVESKEKNIVVMSAAASGKTKVLVERVNFLLSEGVEPKDIVVLTFTNAAAEEMKKRIENSDGIFMGTIHAYANYLLLCIGHSTEQFLNEDDFDELFNEIQKYPESIKKVKYLLLDEAQDSNELQFDFILNDIKPYSFFIVGDNRQSIYGWRGGRPDMFYDISLRSDVTTYKLTENYRNGKNILNFAKTMLSSLRYEYQDDSISKSNQEGRVITTTYDIEKILTVLKNKQDDYKDWFILTRTNKDLDDIFHYLEKNKIPCDTFKRSELTNGDLVKKMEEDTVKILTIHTSKGLEAKNVIVINPQYYNDEELRVSYVAATRAKLLLIWMKKARTRKPKIINWE